MRVSRKTATELIEFANTGALRRKVVTEPKTVRFRVALRAALERISAGDHLLPEQIALFEGIAARHLKLSPARFDRKTLSWSYSPPRRRNLAADFSHDVLEFYGARQSDDPRDARRFPGDLRRCQLESCGKFFFISDRQPDASTGGRPPDRYCSPECTRKKNAEGSTDRSRRFREPKESAK
jgi:hypothetical protein